MKSKQASTIFWLLLSFTVSLAHSYGELTPLSNSLRIDEKKLLEEQQKLARAQVELENARARLQTHRILLQAQKANVDKSIYATPSLEPLKDFSFLNTEKLELKKTNPEEQPLLSPEKLKGLSDDNKERLKTFQGFSTQGLTLEQKEKWLTFSVKGFVRSESKEEKQFYSIFLELAKNAKLKEPTESESSESLEKP